jgi:hypothetical protein
MFATTEYSFRHGKHPLHYFRGEETMGGCFDIDQKRLVLTPLVSEDGRAVAGE